MSAPLAGYSGTPLPRKLGIRPGGRVALVAAPDGFAATLGPLPDAVHVGTRLLGRFDVIVAFGTRHHELAARLPALGPALEPDGGLWLAWPKRTSGLTTDLGDGPVRELGLGAGLVDTKVCAIDATWSALRFGYRLTDRPAAMSR